MADKLEELLKALAASSSHDLVAQLSQQAAEPKVVTVQGPHTSEQLVIAPEGMGIRTCDHLRKSPRHAEENRKLRHLRSFIDYVNQFKGENTALFRHGIYGVRAIIDYHGDAPGWKYHQVAWEPEDTPQWDRWRHEGSSSSGYSHRDFMWLIEDNIEDIVAPDHATLLEKLKGVVSHGTNKADSSVDGHAEGGGFGYATSFSDLPEHFDLAIPFWKGMEKWKIKARIIPRVDNGKITFRYKLVNTDLAIEQMYSEVIAEVQDATSLMVWR